MAPIGLHISYLLATANIFPCRGRYNKRDSSEGLIRMDRSTKDICFSSMPRYVLDTKVTMRMSNVYTLPSTQRKSAHKPNTLAQYTHCTVCNGNQCINPRRLYSIRTILHAMEISGQTQHAQYTDYTLCNGNRCTAPRRLPTVLHAMAMREQPQNIPVKA
jgi:hypothetical protein